MPDQQWTQPLQAVDIAPEKKRRLPWINPTTVLTAALIGYFLDGFKDGVGIFFSWVGLIGLLLGFILLVNDSVEAAIHRKVNESRLALNWLLLIATILVGIYVAPIVGRILVKL
jgi:hypothetical protein